MKTLIPKKITKTPAQIRKEYEKAKSEGLIKKHKAGAYKTTEGETKTIAMDKDEQKQRNQVIWDYLMSLTVFQRQACEMEDIRKTIEEMKTEEKSFRQSCDGINISVKTYQAKLNEYFTAHRKLIWNLKYQKRTLIEAWRVTEKELEKCQKEWVFGEKS